MKKGLALAHAAAVLVAGGSVFFGSFVLLAGGASAAATVYCFGGADLPAKDDKNDPPDLQVIEVSGVGGDCKVKPGKNYYYRNVNILKNGRLLFDEAYAPGQNVDFWANNIIVENGGALIAENSGAAPHRFGQSGSVLTIHLYGQNQSKWNDSKQQFDSQNQGALCVSKDARSRTGQCGVDSVIWDTNGSKPVELPGLDADGKPIEDYFYQYGPLFGDAACTDGTIFDSQKGSCGKGGQVGYFGNKVLAVSYGGTLQLIGYKGTNDNWPYEPEDSGVSWMRLADGRSLEKDDPSLTLEKDPKGRWSKGDEIVVTTTDYLPGHSEKLEIADTYKGGASIPFSASPKNPGSNSAIQWPHNGVRYGGPSIADGNKPWGGSQPRLPERIRNSLASDLVENGAETRAAVALLSRSIRIVSAGDKAGDNFPAPDAVKNPCVNDDGKGPCYAYGAHTVIRQGFKSVQISGVEFKQMGQGGRLAHYPVHFHMARQTPAKTFVADSSVNESMTRWFVIHSTLGVTLARNVGYMSIGHGYYLEAGTETDNKLHSNIGILARGAIRNPQNPRHIPGILADNQDPNSAPFKDPNVQNYGMPYRSDNEFPTVFWITNGWNDFIGNMAAGATACGAGYWFVPTGNSDKPEVGADAHMTWSGYSFLQRDPATGVPAGGSSPNAGATPLKAFYKNSATSSMHSFQTTDGAAPCTGFIAADATPSGTYPEVKEVKSAAPHPVRASVYDPTLKKTVEKPDNFHDGYYPHVIGGARNATQCPSDGKGDYDCSTTPICADGDKTEEKCAVTVLDHYSTSFHWAEGNFSAIWLRAKWYLLDNSFLSDVQNGGYTMITGGDYTKASTITGYWSLARNTVFVGNTRDNKKYPFASNIGPFHGGEPPLPLCDAGQPPAYCLSTAEGISMPFSGFFTNQRLASIYDGPTYQDSNAYLDVTKAGCPAEGYNKECMYGNGVPLLLLRNTPGENDPRACYVPNAAIGWKQPNGFYYAPAFHTNNLFFNNVDIRHFVIDPLFQAPAGVTGTSFDFGQGGTYLSDPIATGKQYCTGNTQVFPNWTSIDRQTELNDDDGTLTGLSNDLQSPNPPSIKQTISVNEDSYFNAPVETAECASAFGANALPESACKTPDPKKPPQTAKTSPYDYVSTVVYHKSTDQELDPWGVDCTNPQCYGVPFYRQYLAGKDGKSESSSTGEWAHWYHNGCDREENKAKNQCRWPFIRMAGTATSQRQTMTINNGLYYLDTTVSKTTQQNEILSNGSTTALNVFTAGNKYYVFFLYAKPSTIQKYQIYVGKSFKTTEHFEGVRVNIDTKNFSFNSVDNPTWATPDYDENTGILTVKVNFSGVNELKPSPAQGLCQPHTFCCPSLDGQTCAEAKEASSANSCVGALKESDPLVLANPKMKDEADKICRTWAMKDLDCPAAGCFGFSFTLNGYTADSVYHRPDPISFPTSNADPKNPQGAPDWTTGFDNTKKAPDNASGGQCYYQSPNCSK